MIKAAVFDFDDTLAIHMESDRINDFYRIMAYKDPEHFYGNCCVAPEFMKKYLNSLRKNGTEKIFCLSLMEYSLNLKAKECFVHQNYGDDIEMLSAGSVDAKLKTLDYLSEILELPESEILYVDDDSEILELAKRRGYSTVPIQKIMVLSERNLF